MYVREGRITDPEQIRNAREALNMYRVYPGGISWIDDAHIVPTEQKADEVIKYLREQFNNSLIYAGEKPEDCKHGKIFFRKIAQLELASEQEKKANSGLAKILGVAPVRIFDIQGSWR